MIQNPQVKCTVHDYLLMPEGGPRYQLVEGELIMAPAPNLYHQRISGRLELILRNFVERHPIGEILDAPVDAFLTETDVYQPDIVFVAEGRSSILKPDGIHGAPDLVIEILSPSSEKIDLGPKKRVYAVCGVREYWVIDPDSTTITVFDLRQAPDTPKRTVHSGDSLTSELLPGLEVDTARVFRQPPPSKS